MNAARWFQRREDYQPLQTPSESPFRKFDVNYSYAVPIKKMHPRVDSWQNLTQGLRGFRIVDS
jgi:hypothetical protein